MDIDDYKIKIDEEEFKKAIRRAKIKKSIDNPQYVQKLLGISDSTLEVYYSAAYQLLEEKKFEDASDAFLFLSFLNPLLHNVWMGLGIALQSQSQYAEALRAYFVAELIDPYDPHMHANAYQCHLALNERDLAMESIDLAIKFCSDHAEFADLKAKLLPLQQELQRAA